MRTFRHRRRVGVLAAAGAGGLLLVSNTRNIPAFANDPNGDGRTPDIANCPDSHPHVTGGGIELASSDPDVEVGSGIVEPEPGAGFFGQANNDTEQPSQMTVTAICAARGQFTNPNKRVSNPDPGQTQIGIKCGQGTKLTGGGVRTTGDHAVEVTSSEPADGNDADSKPDDLWVGSSSNSSGIDVRASCAKKGKFKYIHSKVKPLPDNSQVVARAECPNGTEVTGGGVHISGHDSGLELGGSFPPDESSWKGRAINDKTGQNQKMQVFAICKV